ncbi:MAG: hypothetical protein SCH70_00905 [Candidatus Methanoperedens sp.]|nr:hypothetical protein [Candidatus Methanoperedens sp.]
MYEEKAGSFRNPCSPGNSGDMSGSGVKAHFEWDGKDNLKITIKDKPLIVSCGYLTGKITDFVHDCHGS